MNKSWTTELSLRLLIPISSLAAATTIQNAGCAKTSSMPMGCSLIWIDSSSRTFQYNYSVAVIVQPFIDLTAICCGLNLFCFHVLMQIFKLGCDRFQPSTESNNCFPAFACSPTETRNTHPSNADTRSQDRGIDFDHCSLERLVSHSILMVFSVAFNSDDRAFNLQS